MKQYPAISIIVPTLNEVDNIVALCDRIHESFVTDGISYEVIIVDDNSTDGTVAEVSHSAASHNVRSFAKAGKPGKAYSLLEGFTHATAPVICMIDADLQYPPEAISPMYKLLISRKADVVISERHDNDTSALRKLSSRIFNLVFARFLFGIRYDTQSGLKLFKASILDSIELMPSPWSFDLEFLVRALENKRRILSYPIPFAERTQGVTKVKVLSVTFELARASLMLRAKTSIQKVRAGHRINTQFAKQLTAMAIIGLSLAFGSVVVPGQAHALSPVGDVLDDTTAVVAPILSVTPITTDSSSSDDQTTTPAVSQPVQPMTPVVLGTVIQPSNSNGASTLSQTPMGSASTNTVMAASMQTSSTPMMVTTASPNVAFEGAANDAATATKPYSPYAQGYPTAGTQNTIGRILKYAGLIGLIGGAVYLLSVILLKAISVFKRNSSRATV